MRTATATNEDIRARLRGRELARSRPAWEDVEVDVDESGRVHAPVVPPLPVGTRVRLPGGGEGTVLRYQAGPPVPTVYIRQTHGSDVLLSLDVLAAAEILN